MTEWVLIMFMYAGGTGNAGKAIGTVEFAVEAECLQAINLLTNAGKRYADALICIPRTRLGHR